jgi:ferredoxin
VLDPLSRAAALRVRRDAVACTACGDCDAACPHRIPVSTVGQVTARDCTNCLECVAACGERKALALSLRGRVSGGAEAAVGRALALPVAAGALIVVAFATANAYRVPTLEQAFPGGRPTVAKTVEFTVDGVRCKGTSRSFAEKIGRVPGVVAVTTYARTHTAIVQYDPTLTDPEAIRAAYEAPDVIEGEEYEAFHTTAVRELP